MSSGIHPDWADTDEHHFQKVKLSKENEVKGMYRADGNHHSTDLLSPKINS